MSLWKIHVQTLKLHNNENLSILEKLSVLFGFKASKRKIELRWNDSYAESLF